MNRNPGPQKVSPLIIRSVVIAVLVLTNGGCLEPYAPALITADYNYLVIDGFLVGNDSTFIKLSRSQAIGDPVPYESEIHATVEVESEEGTKYSLSEKSNGVYVAPPLNLTPSLNYRLHIRTDDTKEYYSEYVPLKPSPSLDSVTWKENTATESVHFNVFAHDPENNTRYYLWTADETWKYVSAGFSIYYYKNGEILPRSSSTEIYECWKTIDTGNIYLHSSSTLAEDIISEFELLAIPQASRKFYFGYSLLVKQYALTPEAYAYWSMIKKNSENLGSLFDPLPAQPFSNIHCVNNPAERVIGLFSATTVQKKRIHFIRQDLSGPNSNYSPTGYEDCNAGIILLNDISPSSLQKKLIYDKYHSPVEPFEHLGYVVGHEDCVDCRKKGGVNVKPDYWR